MLFQLAVAPSLGYTSQWNNVGDMSNSGIEVEMNVNIINRKKLNWDVYFNLSTIKNQVDMLHQDNKEESLYTFDGKEYKGYTGNSNFFVAEGLSMYTWRLKKYAGVDKETGEALYYKNVKDEEGNITGTTTTNDWSKADYYIHEGKSTIADLIGGFGTSFEAYGFDFSVNCSFQVGGKGYDATYAKFMSAPSGSTTGYNYHADLLDAWTIGNNNSDIPRFAYGDQYTAAASDRFLTDASYLNIDNINIGYTLPGVWTKRIGVNSLRFYASADNVFYWSRRQGFDPRQSLTSASSAANYSPMRSISGGVTIKF